MVNGLLDTYALKFKEIANFFNLKQINKIIMEISCAKRELSENEYIKTSEKVII